MHISSNDIRYINNMLRSHEHRMRSGSSFLAVIAFVPAIPIKYQAFCYEPQIHLLIGVTREIFPVFLVIAYLLYNLSSKYQLKEPGCSR
jgi:hypothetical protein